MAAHLRLGYPRRVSLRRSRRIAGMAMSLAQLMNYVAMAVIDEPFACYSLVCSAEPGMRTTLPTARVGVRSSGCFPRDIEAAPWETKALAASFPLTWSQLMRWS